MAVPITISFVLPDTTARDLTSFGMSQHAAATVIVGAIDNTTSVVTFRDVGSLKIGTRILCADTHETMIVTALPGSPGSPCTVQRATVDATVTVPGYAGAGVATSHNDQTQVFVLQFSGLVTMGLAGALSLIQSYLQLMIAMGITSETLGSAVLSQAQADAAFQAALNSVIVS